MSDTATDLFQRFSSCTLPQSEWTHEAHLHVGMYFIRTYDLFDAICRLKSGIIQLNAFHKVQNTAFSGYHETLTIFWATVLHKYAAAYPELELALLFDKFLNSPYSKKELVFKFYEEEFLFSASYRAVFQDGTLKSLKDLVIE